MFGGLFRHQEDKDHMHRLAIRCVERNRVRKTKECADRVLQALDAAVRDGNALAKARGAKLLACEKTVENRAPGDSLVVLEKQTGLLEQPFLARDIEINQDVCRGQ